jgi:hypothetical protein
MLSLINHQIGDGSGLSHMIMRPSFVRVSEETQAAIHSSIQLSEVEGRTI